IGGCVDAWDSEPFRECAGPGHVRVEEPRQMDSPHPRKDREMGYLRDGTGAEHCTADRLRRNGHDPPRPSGTRRAFVGGLGSRHTPPRTRLPYCTSLVSTRRASAEKSTVEPSGSCTPPSRFNPGATVSSRSSTKVSWIDSPPPFRRCRLTPAPR